MANDKYILSNNYYVEIEKLGPQSQAVLYNPNGSQVNKGTPSISASILTLIKEIINDYTSVGRDIDKSNWITVPTVVREEVAPKPTKVELKGRVIDSITKEGLRGVKVSLDKFNTTTQPGGGFTLRVTLEPGEKPPEDNIDFKLSKYEPQNTPALKLDGTFKSRINVIELDSLEKSLEKETSNLLVLEEKTISELNKFAEKSPEAIVTETINKEVNRINERLIPFALKLLVEFGITSLDNFAKKSCPPLGSLSGLIAKKNKLTRQINKLLKLVSRVAKIAKILTAIVLAFKIVRKIITKNPIPSTIGGPGLIGVLFSIPMGVLNVIEDKKDKLTKLLDRFGNVIGVLTPSTIPLIASLTKVLDLLSGVDMLIGECLDEARQSVVDAINKEQLAGNTDENFALDGADIDTSIQPGTLTIDDIDFSKIGDARLKQMLGISPNVDFNLNDLLSGTYLQVTLDEELTNITKEEANDGEQIQTEYNGFALDIETQDGKTDTDLKRRYAVGKDTNGVVVVKGEPSYASSDQILINELIFTIDKNDLKPN